MKPHVRKMNFDSELENISEKEFDLENLAKTAIKIRLLGEIERLERLAKANN